MITIHWACENVNECNGRSLELVESRLCDEDKERLANFKSPESMKTFILGRKLLLELLEKDEPGFKGELSLEFLSSGKPKLKKSNMHFSISHTGELVCVVLANSNCGLDLEQIKRFKKSQALAEKICHQNELDILNEHKTPEAYLAKLWTNKEALTKTIGSGFAEGFSNLDLSNLTIDRHNFKFNDKGHPTDTSAFSYKMKNYALFSLADKLPSNSNCEASLCLELK